MLVIGFTPLGRMLEHLSDFICWILANFQQWFAEGSDADSNALIFSVCLISFSRLLRILPSDVRLSFFLTLIFSVRTPTQNIIAKKSRHLAEINVELREPNVEPEIFATSFVLRYMQYGSFGHQHLPVRKQ